jgi:hypothetical protein
MAEAMVERRGIPVVVVVSTTKMTGGVMASAREGEADTLELGQVAMPANAGGEEEGA